MKSAIDQHASARIKDESDLAGFLMTWSNISDPDIYQQALRLWSMQDSTFGALQSDRRVKPGLPPSYPRRK